MPRREGGTTGAGQPRYCSPDCKAPEVASGPKVIIDEDLRKELLEMIAQAEAAQRREG